MLNRLPRHMPPLALMLQDIGAPGQRELARVFGVTERTVRAWLKADAAPLPVMWSIFWLTQWGRSVIDADAVNEARNQAGLARALRSELHAANERIGRLAQIGDFGSANDPLPLPGVAVGGERATQIPGATAVVAREPRMKTAG